MAREQDPALTRGEREALILVARRMTNQEIADQLGTSASGVKTLIHQACSKLKAHNRIEAVLSAIRQRIINVDDIYSPNELVDFFGSLGPDTVETIAGLLRQTLKKGRIPAGSEQIYHQDRTRDSILTRREREALVLVARGMTNQEIADHMCTTVSTVRTFLYQACHKLEANNRAQAFISALRQGALNVDEVYSLDELIELLDSLGPEAMETVARQLRHKLEQTPLK